MGIEIERKFLVKDNTWQGAVTGSQVIRQVYLSTRPAASVRIRIIDGQRARLTIKGASTRDGPALSRSEFEYPVPVEDALAMFASRVGNVVEKKRHHVPAGNGRIWEIDVFAGELEGLVIAEIELGRDDEDVILPEWVGREVTTDRRYANMALAQEGRSDLC